MDDIKIVPRVNIPKVGMQSVRMPIVGNKMDSAIMSIFKDLKSHMIGWYDVKRQGCTNESLTANPVLEDLSGNNHPLELRNFVFGGLSGMGTEKYPNSLVFNGTTPSWVYDRSNITVINSDYCRFEDNKTLKITQYHKSNDFIYAHSVIHINNTTESLTVNLPRYIVRISGLKSNQTIKLTRYLSNSNGVSYQTINDSMSNGTYLIPAYKETFYPNNQNTIRFNDFRVQLYINDIEGDAIQENPVDITIEFLPNYPAPTTKMYGAIPSLTQGAKCMMMDFVPINEKSTVASQGCCYYSQRVIDVKNYSIYSFNDIYDNFDKETAYNGRNSNGTFINCVKNNKRITALSLFQKRQVVGVNTQNPANTYPVIGISNTLNHNAQMALNSLLLFDKELTEEEMKVVMDRIMKYKNVDGIDMLSAPDKIGFTVGEYDGGGDIWEMD